MDETWCDVSSPPRLAPASQQPPLAEGAASPPQEGDAPPEKKKTKDPPRVTRLVIPCLGEEEAPREGSSIVLVCCTVS